MKTKSDRPKACGEVDASCFRRSFFETLARWWWAELLLLLGLPVAVVLLAGAVAKTRPKHYESTALIEILSPGERSNAFREGPSDNRLPPEFLASQCEILRSGGCLAKVVTSLNLSAQWRLADVQEVMARLKSRLRTQVLPGTHLVRVTAWSTNPGEARDLATEVVRAYRETRRIDSENAGVAELEALKKEIRNQEDRVEARRKLLAQIARTKAIPYYPGPEPAVVPPATQPTAETLQQQVTDSLGRQDYVDAKRAFEMEDDFLMQMKRERLEGEVRAKRPNPILIVREDPVVAAHPAHPDVKKAAGGGVLLALLLVIPLACLFEGFSLCRRRKRCMAQLETASARQAETGA